MELKEKAQAIKEFFKIDDIKDLPDTLLRVTLYKEHDCMFDEYISLVGGLDIDYIQKSYQFWLSDRGKGSLQQDYTPVSIAKLVAKMADCPSGGTVFDCCAGSGALTIAKHREDSSLKFVCIELDSNAIPLLLFNLAIRNIEATVINGNALTGEYKKIYSLKPTEKYCVVEEIVDFTIPECDVCISNPPYNIPWEPQEAEIFAKYGIPPKGNANFAFVLKCLELVKEKGQVVQILPTGILTSSDGQTVIRANLTKAGCLNSVITLPDKMFESTGIGTCIIRLQNCGSTQVSMIDARNTYHEEVRHQRGEGDKSHTERVYHKTFKILNDDDINKILQAADKSENIAGFSACVKTEHVASNEYIWSPSKFIAIKPAENKHREYADIVADLRRIAREKSAVKITMNQKVAKDLGWDEIARLEETAMENGEQINSGIIKLLGLEPIEYKTYISISKNAGEVKIENKRRDSVSGLFLVFLPMFRQHLSYLNDRENELLAELRDAVLPDLMNGELDVTTLDA